MSIKLSRIIMALEIVLIELPMLAILFLVTLVSIRSAPEFSDYWIVFTFLLLIIVWLAIVAGIIISIIFVKKGGEGLRNLKPKYLWTLCYLGASLPISSLIIFYTSVFASQPLPLGSDMLEILKLFIVASPLLIPFAHLLLERYSRKVEKYEN